MAMVVAGKHIMLCHHLFIQLLLIQAVANAHVDVVAVLLAHERPQSLRNTLDSYAAAINVTPQFLTEKLSLIVSVDDGHDAESVIATAHSEPLVKHVFHHIPPSSLSVRHRISLHYHFALTTAFNGTATHVIVIEDDLLFSEDFFSYILSSLPYLSAPDTAAALVCTSAWNDNGRRASNPSMASLTTFFPGLGWALSRSLWQSLSPIWPGIAPNTSVGVGWDFWLRILFEQKGWSCVTPRVPRVFHAATGANVSPTEKKALFDASLLADVPIGHVDWPTILQHKMDPIREAKRLDDLFRNVKHVQWLREAIQIVEQGGNIVAVPYLRERYEREVATILQLWPTPRGHFRYTLEVTIGTGSLILYDARRAPAHFASLPRHSPATVIVATRNASCSEACKDEGMTCTADALEDANICERMTKVVGVCKACAYETGGDLPAFVVTSAPLETKGFCLITESGVGRGGKLLCGARFEWTRRVCGCTGSKHDEL